MITILLVEDSVYILILYKSLLTQHNFEVIATAMDGVEAVEVYKSMSPKPDVVIMDHLMPIKNGMQAMEEILKIDPNAKIIFVSGDSKMKEPALTIGAVSFTLKPFSLEDLIRNIHILVDRSTTVITPPFPPSRTPNSL